MIVHAPTLSRGGGDICIAARFELRNPLPNLPQELWYRFPESYESRLAPRADGFAATALLVAMYAGEDLTIRGPLSPRLAYHLYEFNRVFNAWLPKLFQLVDIRFEQLQEVPAIGVESGVATAFSGGVDSFYTLWCHLPENQPVPAARITHGLFVRGQDLRLDDVSNYEMAATRYAELFKSMGLELMLAATNAYQFSEFRIDWTLFDGPPLIGAALLMSPFLRRFYLPSGMPSYVALAPQGSHPMTDHFLSTEALEVVHHGTAISRYDKLAVLAKWPLTYHQLRVCSDKLRMQGLQNCSACHKCYRTISILSLLDALPNYNNFNQKLTVKDYLRWGLLTHLNARHVRQIRAKAMQSGRFGMAFMIQAAIILQSVKRFSVRMLKRALTRDQLYRIKRKIYPPESHDVGQAK